MFSWLIDIDKPLHVASRTVDIVPSWLPPTFTLTAASPAPGMMPVSDALLHLPSFTPLKNPLPAYPSAASSIPAAPAHVPSQPVVSLPPGPPLSPPPPPPPPPFSLLSFMNLRNKLEVVYADLYQFILTNVHAPAWLSSTLVMINNTVDPYRQALVMACLAIQQSPIAEVDILASFFGSGTLTVKDILVSILGDRPFNQIDPAIQLAKQSLLSHTNYYKVFITWNRVFWPESLMARLETEIPSLFAASGFPLLSPLVFRWFRALLWAALSSLSALAYSLFRKFVVMLPLWLQEPVAFLFPPPHPSISFLEAFDDYISNELPTHLIRLKDMKLVGRDDIREALRPRIAIMTEADLIFQTLCHNIVDPNHQLDYCFSLAIQHHLKFAIFSHRWGPQEPSFRAMMEANPETLRMFPRGPGFHKLFKFCEEARRYGCTYAWSDTCCINKESSSELQEAIRSMYRWYRNAEVCIALLAESVSPEDFEFEPWFTRGWTLQELLAPRRIKFYGKYWIPIKAHFVWTNDKLDGDLLKKIEEVTMIPQEDLKEFTPSCSKVYEKMIWASKRRTTRVEDRAYCLLGIFDITMSISYGEGYWAFHRLMEIIMERCGESGIFAWSGKTSPYSLAIPASPACYTVFSFLPSYRDYPSAALQALAYPLEELRKVEKNLGLTDSASFTVTKDGLNVELFVVDATMTSAHRRNKSLKVPWDEARPSLNLADVRFHDVVLRPKWTLRRNWPKKSVEVGADERDLKRCSAWAIGILCSGDVDGYATLEAGKEYMSFLIGKVRKGKRLVWVRFRTQNIATLFIDRNVRSRLQTVHVPHKLSS